jgi:hypothetical protein
MFEARLFLLRIFFVQVCARGDPEQDYCHDDYRRREQADLFRDGHAMPLFYCGPRSCSPSEATPSEAALRRPLILCSRLKIVGVDERR